jgi:hypothetical protein
MNPAILIPNYVLLALCYAWFLSGVLGNREQSS